MKFWILTILSLLGQIGYAAHLVGGEISYECLGNNNYEITLKVYRDCNSSGAPFDPQASIAIFKDVNMSQFTVLSPSHQSILNLPATVNNPCLQTPPNVCTQLAIYKTTVVLPPYNGGYIITYQRCCRNNTITNIPAPGTWGSTYTVRVPPATNNFCNSSPEFLSNPPIVLCNTDSLFINSAAGEKDGDSLFYEFCDPLHGGSQGQPAPVPPSPPPYQNVPFSTGYSASTPLPGNPQIQIDSQTGLISGRPTTPGQFVIAICVSEYKNGVYLSTVRRDYQFNVVNCQSNVQASFIANQLYCTGRSVTFSDNSINGSNHYWDFGAPGNTDTSTQRNPVFTFPDTGAYQVTLIVNKGWACADTIVKNIRVHYPANASFNISGPKCLDNGSVIFTTTSNNTGADFYEWNFGNNASPATSNDRHPPPVQFLSPGKHVVSLKVNSFGCLKTVFDTVEIHLKPEGAFDLSAKNGCVPFTVNFLDSSVASTNLYYEWDFGDGNVSNQTNPTHTYQNPGIYDVKLRVYTTEGCVDTSIIFKPGLITAKPSPTSLASVSPLETTIYEALIEANDLGTPAGEDFYFDMGNGTIFRNQKQVFYQYADTGNYSVKHVVINSAGCADTTHFKVRVKPVPLIFVPNAFSPNGDGKNDIFLPAIVGAREYEFQIYNRWGQVIFHTTNPNIGWNGQLHNTGKMQPGAVYSYSIFVRDINFEVATKKGVLTLIR